MRKFKGAANYKPQAKTVNIHRVTTDDVPQYDALSYNRNYGVVASEGTSTAAAFFNSGTSHLRTQDALTLPASASNDYMDCDPAPHELMDVDDPVEDSRLAEAGRSMLSSDVSMASISGDAVEDFSDTCSSMDVDTDMGVPLPAPAFPAFANLAAFSHESAPVAPSWHSAHVPTVSKTPFQFFPVPQTSEYLHKPSFHPQEGARTIFSDIQNHSANPANALSTSALDHCPAHTNTAYETESARSLQVPGSDFVRRLGQTFDSSPSTPTTEPQTASFAEETNIVAPPILPEREPTTPPYRNSVDPAGMSPITASPASTQSGKSSCFDIAELARARRQPPHSRPVVNVMSSRPVSREVVQIWRDNTNLESAAPKAPTIGDLSGVSDVDAPDVGSGPTPAAAEASGGKTYESKIDADGKPSARLTAKYVMDVLKLRFDRLNAEQNRIPRPISSSKKNGSPIISGSTPPAAASIGNTLGEKEKVSAAATRVENETGHTDISDPYTTAYARIPLVAVKDRVPLSSFRVSAVNKENVPVMVSKTTMNTSNITKIIIFRAPLGVVNPNVLLQKNTQDSSHLSPPFALAPSSASPKPSSSLHMVNKENVPVTMLKTTVNTSNTTTKVIIFRTPLGAVNQGVLQIKTQESSHLSPAFALATSSAFLTPLSSGNVVNKENIPAAMPKATANTSNNMKVFVFRSPLALVNQNILPQKTQESSHISPAFAPATNSTLPGPSASSLGAENAESTTPAGLPRYNKNIIGAATSNLPVSLQNNGATPSPTLSAPSPVHLPNHSASFGPGTSVPLMVPPTPWGIIVKPVDQQFICMWRNRRIRCFRLLSAADRKLEAGRKAASDSRSSSSAPVLLKAHPGEGVAMLPVTEPERTPPPSTVTTARRDPIPAAVTIVRHEPEPVEVLAPAEHERAPPQPTIVKVRQCIVDTGAELKVLPGAFPEAGYHNVGFVHASSMETSSFVHRISRRLFGW